MDDATLAPIIRIVAVVFAVEFFSGAIGRCCDGRFSFAALDLGDTEMIKCYSASSFGSRAIASGSMRIFSIKEKKSASPISFVAGARCSIAAPFVISRCARFCRSPFSR